MKEGEMDGAYRTHGIAEKYVQTFSRGTSREENIG